MIPYFSKLNGTIWIGLAGYLLISTPTKLLTKRIERENGLIIFMEDSNFVPKKFEREVLTNKSLVAILIAELAGQIDTAVEDMKSGDSFAAQKLGISLVDLVISSEKKNPF